MNKYSQEKTYTTADMQYIDGVVADIMKPIEQESGHWARKLFLLGLLLSLYSEDDADVAPLDKIPSMDIETGYLTGKTALPPDLQAVPNVESVLPLNLDQQKILKLAEQEIATYITGISDKVRQEIREAIINAQMQKVHPQQLAHDLYNRFKGIQKNWRLIAITENAMIASIGFMSRMKDGEELQSHSMADACPECKKLLNGRKFKFSATAPLSATDPIWDTHIWIGKNNVGRTRKNWKPCIPLHPACRCWWTVAYLRKAIMEILNKAGATTLPPAIPTVGKKATPARVPALNQSAGKLGTPSAQKTFTAMKTPSVQATVPPAKVGAPSLEPSKLKGQMRPGHKYVWREGESGNYVYHYADEGNNAYTSKDQLHHDFEKPIYESHAPEYADSSRKKYDDNLMFHKHKDFTEKYNKDEYLVLVRVTHNAGGGRNDYEYYNPITKEGSVRGKPIRNILNDKPVFGTNFDMPLVENMPDEEYDNLNPYGEDYLGKFAEWQNKQKNFTADPVKVDEFMNKELPMSERELIYLKREHIDSGDAVYFFANPLNGKLVLKRFDDLDYSHHDPLMAMTGDQKWADIKKEGRVDLDDVMNKQKRWEEKDLAEQNELRKLGSMEPAKKEDFKKKLEAKKEREKKAEEKRMKEWKEIHKFNQVATPTAVVRFEGAKQLVEKHLKICAEGKHEFVENMSNGINQTIRVHIPNDGDAVVKHRHSERQDPVRATVPVGEQFMREALAYDMDRLLNLGVVPPTVRGKLNKETARIIAGEAVDSGELDEADLSGAIENLTEGERDASMQHFLNGDLEEGAIGDAEDEAVQRLALFDYICGNSDRHYANYFLDKKTGHLLAIDNGLAFTLANWYNRDAIREFYDRDLRVDEDILDDLKKTLTPEGKKKIKEAFKNSGITGHEEYADVTLHRLKYVVKHGTIPEDLNAYDAKAKGFKSWIENHSDIIEEYSPDDLNELSKLAESQKPKKKMKKLHIVQGEDYRLQDLDRKALRRGAQEFEYDNKYENHDANRLWFDEIPVLLDEKQTGMFQMADISQKGTSQQDYIKRLADNLDYPQLFKVLRMGVGRDFGNDTMENNMKVFGELAYARYTAMQEHYDKRIAPYLNDNQFDLVNKWFDADEAWDKLDAGRKLIDNMHANHFEDLYALMPEHQKEVLEKYRHDRFRKEDGKTVRQFDDPIPQFWKDYEKKHGAEQLKAVKEQAPKVVDDKELLQSWLQKFDDDEMKYIINKGLLGNRESIQKAQYDEAERRGLKIGKPQKVRGQS